ncbi:hypothetical protein ACQFN5_29115 (plasmid) [Klebsiella sp. WOUb02]
MVNEGVLFQGKKIKQAGIQKSTMNAKAMTFFCQKGLPQDVAVDEI